MKSRESLNTLIDIFKKEWIHLFTSPKLLFLIIGIPLFLFYYYYSLFNKGVPERFPIAVIDQDKSSTSRQLIRMFQSSPTFEITEDILSFDEANRLIKTDKIYAYIIIPSHFERDIYRSANETQIICYYNGQYILPSSLIYKAFQTVAMTFSTGIHMNTLMKSGQSYQQAFMNSNPIALDLHILYNPYTNYAYYLNIALLPMALQIIIIVIGIYTLGSILKFKKGAYYYKRTNGNPWILYWGKMLPYTFVFMIIGFFMNSLIFHSIDMPLRNIFLANLCFFLFLLASQFFSVFFIALFASLRSALTFGGGMAAISFSFSGYTFPMEGMPLFIQKISYIFPYASYVRLTIDQVVRGFPLQSDWKYIFTLSAFCFLGFFSLFRYNQLLKNSAPDL